MAGSVPTGAASAEIARSRALTAPTHTDPPASSRTRRIHGGWSAGLVAVVVSSSRRTADGDVVTLSLSNGSVRLDAKLVPSEARAVADALRDAAGSVEQREVHHG